MTPVTRQPARRETVALTRARKLKTFRVHFSTWQCFARNIEAADEAEAIDIALELKDREGTDAFTCINSGWDDLIEADEERDTRLD